MNLDDFEQSVNMSILRRGREYYKDGRVDLAVFRDGVYGAGVVGSDDYSVAVKLDGDKNIVEAECDCPYTDGPYCKHMVAVFYAIRDRQRGLTAPKQPKAAKVVRLFPVLPQAEKKTLCGKDEIFRVLSKQPKKRLLELLAAVAEGSEAVMDYLRAELVSGEKEKDNWIGLMRRHIDKAMDEDGFISYRDCEYALKGAYSVLGRAKRAGGEGDYGLAVALALAVLHEMVEMVGYADDSGGDIGDVIHEATGLMGAVAAQPLPASVAGRCFKQILAEAGDSVYDGWMEWRTDLLDICVALATTPGNRRDLDNCLDRLMAKIAREKSERKGSWGSDYDAEQVALVRYNVVVKFDGPAKAADFLQENIRFSRFRELAIEQAMAAEEYGTAERLALEGERQDRPLPGLVRQWKEARYAAYQKSGQSAKVRSLGLELALAGDFDYYIKLKGLYDSAEWNGVYPGIIESVNKDAGYVREGIYPKILIEEKEWQKLVAYVEEKPVRIVDFYRCLLKDFRGEVYRLFVRHLADVARVAANRRDYREVCAHLRLLVKIGGKKEAADLIEAFRQTYKRRPAFQEELLSVKVPEA
jgi:hypothetical protein